MPILARYKLYFKKNIKGSCPTVSSIHSCWHKADDSVSHLFENDMSPYTKKSQKHLVSSLYPFG